MPQSSLKMAESSSPPSLLTQTSHSGKTHGGSTVRTIKIKHLVDGMGYIYPQSAEWGAKFPEANGTSQSPVNINSREAIYDDTLNNTPLLFNYALSRETDMCNNGHCVVVYPKYKQGESGYRLEQLAIPKSFLSGGPFPVGQEYELAEFRFHWGRDDSRGSEHNVNGKAFPLELHLIHWNSSLYPSLEEALGKPGGIAIVAIFIQIGREHTGLKFMTEHLEDIWYKGRHVTISTAFNPNCLLPDPMLRDFWTYEGSLTSPPCSEGVTWVILRSVGACVLRTCLVDIEHVYVEGKEIECMHS